MGIINVSIRSVYVKPREPRAGEEVSLAILISYRELSGRTIWYGVEVDNIYRRYERRYVRPFQSFTTGLGSFIMPNKTVTVVFKVGHYENGRMVEDGRRTITITPRPPARPPVTVPPPKPKVEKEIGAWAILLVLLAGSGVVGYVLGRVR